MMEDKKCPVVIPNSLADVILLVGVDDVTGLNPVDENTQVDVYDGIFELNYQPQVITVISATDMVNFTPFPHTVESYPPVFDKETMEMNQEKIMRKQRERMMNEFNLTNKMSFHPSKTLRSGSVGPKMLRTMSVVRHAGASNKISSIPELPISDEVIQSISTFCFPDGLKVYDRKPENTSHFFVLTDISGQRTYATCVTFYRPYLAEKDSSGNLYLTFSSDTTEVLEPGQLKCYFPQCCVAISKYPYYTILKECLSSMLMYIEKDTEEMIGFLKEYANIMTHTAVPPAGNIAVNFCVYNMPVTIHPPTHPDKPVIDLPLHLTLSCFHVEEFLKVLSCILMEEKIVFLCSNYSLLTIVMESLMHLILPFKWRFTYSTILPSSMLGFLEAPGVFMYGVHRRYLEDVVQVDDLVLIDIDEGTLQVSSPCNGIKTRNNRSLFNIPVPMATAFKKKWRKLIPRFDLDDTQRPYCYNLEQLRQYELRRTRNQNVLISSACLELMVILFKDVVGMLRVEHNHFNKEQFLQEHSEDRAFYEKIFRTDMFKTFLAERISEKPDYWSDLEMKSRGYSLTKSTQGSVMYPNKPRRYTLSHITPGDNREITLFTLEDIKVLKIHVKNTIKQITKAMEVSNDHDVWTSLLHLRALYHCGDGNKMVAMDDFIKLSTAKSRILPTNVLSDLYNQMSEDEKSQFKKKQGHELLLDFIEKNSEGQRRARITMDPIEIPDTDLNFFNFEDFVSLKQMSNDHRTIRLLFEALTQEPISKTSVLKQITFEMFVCCWENNRCDCKQLKIIDSKLSDDEMILKVSKYVIKTDYGLGRIVLTNRRIFFVRDVANKYVEITKLRDIIALEKSESSTLFSRVSTLKILMKNVKNGSFTAHLKDARDWWYMVIYEMWAGKVMAEAMKDDMMIHHAIQTTLLIDAVVASGQQECTTHSENSVGAAELLGIYTKLLKAGKHKLPKDTKEALQRKIDVNIGEKDSKTIQSLLYSGGGEHSSPRLWCGLTDGRIKIFNAISWLTESEILISSQVVACLTDVGENQVWAGSYGIYIIDSRTLTSTKTLLNHTDLVVSIVVYDDRSVYTASLDGTIIKWNKQKLTHSVEIKLTNIQPLRSLKICNDRLICGSWTNILICDLEGTSLKLLDFIDNNKCIEIDSYAVTPHGQVWAGSRRNGKVFIWDINTVEFQKCITVDDNCRGISSMEIVNGKVWIGAKDGNIHVYTLYDQVLWKKLEGHDDAVRVQCDVRDRYMVSGGGSKDGRVCIWKADSQGVSQYLLASDEHIHGKSTQKT
ncbi:Rab guanyl-nucleotide exchange factor [Mactra antiquata]